MVTPSPDEPPTRRDFDRLVQSVDQLNQTIKELATLYVHQDVYDKDQIIHGITHQGHTKDISDLESIVKWVVGFVFAGVGAAILTAVLR